jgi:hypothetical protein
MLCQEKSGSPVADKKAFKLSLFYGNSQIIINLFAGNKVTHIGREPSPLTSRGAVRPEFSENYKKFLNRPKLLSKITTKIIEDYLDKEVSKMSP